MNKDVNLDELLSRGVGEFIDPEGVFRKKLETNPEKVVIKFGVDPTRPDIHLGHAVVLRTLRKFQNLGCKIVFLIGDYTAQIGDPTGKSSVRPEISFEDVRKNAATYLDQVGKILDTSNKDKYSVIWNSVWYQSATDYPTGTMAEKSYQWEQDRAELKTLRSDHGLATITLWNFMSTLRKITHAQLIERDLFQKRLNTGTHLFMHEMMYPVLQGTDSWAIEGFYGSCDLEVGGTDQTFNMLMGRTVMKHGNQIPQAVLAFKLLQGLDGKEKMSKSLDNYIGIDESPSNIYGKVMSLPDILVKDYFELCTDLKEVEVDEILALHPKEAKVRLAFEIVKIYHGEAAAQAAKESFEQTFSKGGIPEDVTSVSVPADKPLVDILLEEGLVASKTEFTRLMKDGAINEIEPGIYRIGKHRFIKIERV